MSIVSFIQLTQWCLMSNLDKHKFGTFLCLSSVLAVAVDQLLLGRESELEHQVLGEGWVA